MCEVKLLANAAFEKTSSLQKVELLKQENIILKQEIIILKNEVEWLKQDIERLNIIYAKLNIQEDDLILGQVAYDIERYIVRIVLGPFVGPSHYITSIKKIQSALKGDEDYTDLFSPEIQQQVARRWKDLQEVIHWSLDLFRFMNALKKGRISSAHQKVNEDKAIAAMKKLP